MKREPIEILKSALGRFFANRFYVEGVEELRTAIRDNPYYRENWESVIRIVVFQQMEPGIALKSVTDWANLPLDDDSDKEAYSWLALMLINVSGGPGHPILEY